MFELISEAGYSPFKTELYGVEISREVEHCGFKGGEITSDVLLAEEGVYNEYYFKFTMKKLD